MDFLDRDKSILVDGVLNKIPESIVWKDILIPESQWFTVNENQAYKALNMVSENYDNFLPKSMELGEKNTKKFTLSNMSNKLKEIMDKYTSHITADNSSPVSLKLPKLKKVKKDDNSMPSLKLPKLKKITKEV